MAEVKKREVVINLTKVNFYHVLCFSITFYPWSSQFSF